MGKKSFAKISYYSKIVICQLLPHITHINWVSHIQTLDYMQSVLLFTITGINSLRTWRLQRVKISISTDRNVNNLQYRRRHQKVVILCFVFVSYMQNNEYYRFVLRKLHMRINIPNNLSSTQWVIDVDARLQINVTYWIIHV